MMFLKLFHLIRNLLAIIGLCSLLVGGVGLYLVAKSYNLPPRLLVLKALKKYGLENSALAEVVKPDPVRPAGLELPPLDDPDWQGHGARRDRALRPLVYDLEGRPLPSELEHDPRLVQSPEPGRVVAVSNAGDLQGAIKRAVAGDVITLEPGVYRIMDRNIEVMAPGTPKQPIIVRASRLGEVTLELGGQEGFWVNAPYWVFENLDIKGIAANDDYGEHAFHIVAGGNGFVLRNSRIHEFNAMIKANGHRQRDGVISFPDGALIENNAFFNSRVRRTSNPVTFIDVVGPNDWTVRGNLIADFCKGEGDRISYGAFIKGNSSNGVFENNLVIGEYATTGGVRVGLSLGGGGSGAKFSRGETNEVEHTGGIVRNNIVMYCSDVGLYLNKARDTKVVHNTFYRTMGVDVRFPESSAVVRNNLLTGRIKERDGGSAVADHNLVGDKGDFADWFKQPDEADFSLLDGGDFVDKGVETGLSQNDFCGKLRSNQPDIGALEYDRDGICRNL